MEVVRSETLYSHLAANQPPSTVHPADQTASTHHRLQGGIGLSALPLLTGQAGKVRRSQEGDSDSDGDNDGLLWAVSGVVSAIPFVNWLSWVRVPPPRAKWM